ncbi:hypothetical protein L596_020809 [Steinernema carpocapsae]|uniref:F-box domain-containing protein n=2 Tax=Steinernema carpocapsae TaxID=34508 RepID=A0A4U5MUU2_STECR|nr:hypothetical protein L596_020809 [Steinernema carpocapsae]
MLRSFLCMGSKPSCMGDNESVNLDNVDGFTLLPPELKRKIASYLSVDDGLLRMRLVSPLWNDWIVAYLSDVRMSARLHVAPNSVPKFAIDNGKPHTLKDLKKLPPFFHVSKLNSFEEYANTQALEEAWNNVIQFMSLPPCQNLTSIAVPSIPAGEYLTYFCERFRKYDNLEYIRLLVKNEDSFMAICEELKVKDTLKSIKFHLPYGNELTLNDPIWDLFSSQPSLHTLLMTGHGTYSNDLVEKLVVNLVENPRKMNLVLPVRPWVAYNLPTQFQCVRCTQIGEAYYSMMPNAQYTLKITSTPSMTYKISGHFQIEMAPSWEFDEFKSMILKMVVDLVESMGNANARRRLDAEVFASYRQMQGLVYDVQLDAITLKRDASRLRVDPPAFQRVLNSHFQAVFHSNVSINVNVSRDSNFVVS